MSVYAQFTPKCSLKNLVLPEKVSGAIAELLEDYKYVEALLEEGLPVRRKVLLHGPPGCGKTSIAHALAGELDTKLFCASLAQIVGSHVGEGSRGIDSVFQFAASNKCVMLIDEFDSIGTARMSADSPASLEANRTVNTVLTCLENRPPMGMVIAATNFFGALDQAILRRFDLVIEVPPATRAALRAIAESVVRGRFGIKIDAILEEASTPAMVVQIATDRVRSKVIEREKLRESETLPIFGPEEARKIRKKLEKPAEAAV